MFIAIAGGHGGAGRTTIATGLALTLMQTRTARVALADADVEKPATDQLLRPLIREERAVSLTVPNVTARCTGCGRCVELCRFHALALHRERAVLFPELCSGCLACLRECPEGTLEPSTVRLGLLRVGRVGSIPWAGGLLDVGAAWPRPLVRATIDAAKRGGRGVLIVDGPMGSDPPALEAVRGADVTVVVVEPTLLGLAALQRTTAALRDYKPGAMGVVVNRDVGQGTELDAYCAREGLAVLARLPFDERITHARLGGLPVVAALPEYLPWFTALYAALCEVVSR